MSGTPFAANPLTGLYYPPNWLFLFLPWLPLEVGFNLSALAHLWLAGVGMYMLLRRGFGFGVGMWGAWAAAVIYEASPKLLAHLGAGHVGWAQAWGWLPVVVLCWMRVGGRQPLVAPGQRMDRWVMGAGAALAMQFCADVRMAVYTLAVVLMLTLVFTIRNTQYAIRNLLFLVCSLVVFIGLAACQWLPTAALLPETTRASMTLHDAAAWSLPWQYLAGLLLADHGGFHEWMTYVGVSALVLAGIGVGALWRERRERWLVGGVVGLLVGAAWFGLGENGGLFQALWRVAPDLGLLRVPPRAWVLVVFAVAVLAGLGVEAMQKRGDQVTRRFRRWKRASWLAIGVFPPALMVGHWLWVGAPPLNLVMFGVLTPLIVAACGSQFAIRNSQLWGGVVVLIVIADLLVVDVTLIEARSPAEVFADGRAAAEWLATRPGRFRVYSSYAVPQHVAELYGLELVEGVDPLQLRVYADYLTRAAGLEPHGYSITLPPLPEGTGDIRMALSGVTPNAEMLGRLGVRYIVAAFPILDRKLQLMDRLDEVYVYRNEEAQPVVDGEWGHAIELSDGVTLFRYSPSSVYVGWWVSGVTVVGLLVLWVLRENAYKTNERG